MQDKPKRRKILFVMQLPPPVHGASVMNQQIKRSTRINDWFNCDYINLATAKNIEDLQKNRLSKYFKTARIILKTFVRILTSRYNYVYITVFPYGPAFIKDSIIVILVKLLRLKPILHLHTYGFKKGANRSVKWKKYYKSVFKNSEVVCLSELLIEDVENIFIGSIFLLPNGIPQVNFVNEYNNNQDPINLLYLSNLIAGKGVIVIVEALAILKSKGIPFRMRIVGSEGDVSYQMLQDLIKKKNLEDNVVIAGPKYGKDKEAEFRNAGLFLLPSNYDTFGLVLLEAMQFGVPCISTNIGGIPDVLGDGRGFIIKEISAIALADAIEFLVKNPTVRAEMSKKGFDYYNSHFTDKIFEERLKNILNGEPDFISNKLLQS